MISIVIIILLIIIVFWVLYWSGTAEHRTGALGNGVQLDYYDFNCGGGASPFICFIAGTHGNEPAGSIALNQLVQEWQLNPPPFTGRIRVIPNINAWGLANNIRYKSSLSFLPDADINRNYNEQGGTDIVSRGVLELVQGADLVVDFHEGWGYHVCQPQSVGSTLTPTDFHPAPEIARRAQIHINASTPNTESFCAFAVRQQSSCDIKSTIACHMQKNQRPYILVETTGQNDVQPMKTRTDQVRMVVATTLAYFQ